MEKNNVPKTWWEEFKEEYADNPKINKIIELIEFADKSTTEKNINKAIKAIEALSDKKYAEEKEKLYRRISILQKRLDRSVSNEFGVFLRKLREERGLTIKELAEMVNVSPSYINKLEIGLRNAPTYPILAKIAEALSVDINSILKIAMPSTENNKEVDLTELIFSYKFHIKSQKNPEVTYSMSKEAKSKLVDLINYVVDMDWDKDKHLDLLNISSILDEFKEALKNDPANNNNNGKSSTSSI